MAGWQEREHVSIKFPLETDHSHMLQQTHSPPPPTPFRGDSEDAEMLQHQVNLFPVWW